MLDILRLVKRVRPISAFYRKKIQNCGKLPLIPLISADLIFEKNAQFPNEKIF
jgi:hypothetical protein